MPKIIRSAVFKRQLLDITASYRERAGSAIALKFVDQVEACVGFVAVKPYACAIYTKIEGKEFRKWSLKDFPVSVFFRLEDSDTIILEALYAHRMNISARLLKEMD